MTGEEYFDEDICPCDSCPSVDSCDGWEARFCCTYCYWMNEYPNCEDCNSLDI